MRERTETKIKRRLFDTPKIMFVISTILSYTLSRGMGQPRPRVVVTGSEHPSCAHCIQLSSTMESIQSTCTNVSSTGRRADNCGL